MANYIKGKWTISTPTQITIIVSRFNELVTDKLLDGALEGLAKCGIEENQINVIHVPGAFELPYMAKKVAKLKQGPTGIIALGAVIKGATDHYHYVCSQTTSGLGTVSLETETPIMFGLLTTDTLEQALERAGSKVGNKGFEAALGLIEMLSIEEKMIEG